MTKFMRPEGGINLIVEDIEDRIYFRDCSSVHLSSKKGFHSWAGVYNKKSYLMWIGRFSKELLDPYKRSGRAFFKFADLLLGRSIWLEVEFEIIRAVCPPVKSFPIYIVFDVGLMCGRTPAI